MKFFIDTANIEEIKELNDLGLIDGVTTNPSLIKQSGRNMIEVITEICGLVEGPVSAEVVANDFEGMKREGEKLAKIAENIAIKVPLTWDGLKACRYFADGGLMVNVTLCFSAQQALLAAKAGAAFVSPFVGRLDDIGANGMSLIADIAKIYENYFFETEILVASVRSPQHVVDAAKIGADVATVPYKVLRQLVQHPLTDKGLEIFNADWAATGQKI
jgi:transaldolase